MTHIALADLCRELALLLHAGIGTADALELLARDGDSPLPGALTRAVDAGAALSEAMEACGGFDTAFTGLIRVGEQTGRLEEALTALADYHEGQHLLRRRLRQALAYPALLTALLLGVIAVVLVRVLPVFQRVYASLGSGLTGVSAWLLALGEGLGWAGPALLTGAAVLAAAGALCCLQPGLRRRLEGWGAARFGDRGIFARFANARFAQALAMGVASGMALEEAVELAARLLADNPGARARCRRCAEALADDADLAGALTGAGLLAAPEARLLAAGLRSGSGEAVLGDIARRMQAEAWAAADAALGRIEPALVLSASALVGVILLSVLLPLAEILTALG